MARGGSFKVNSLSDATEVADVCNDEHWIQMMFVLKSKDC